MWVAIALFPHPSGISLKLFMPPSVPDDDLLETLLAGSSVPFWFFFRVAFRLQALTGCALAQRAVATCAMLVNGSCSFEVGIAQRRAGGGVGAHSTEATGATAITVEKRADFGFDSVPG